MRRTGPRSTRSPPPAVPGACGQAENRPSRGRTRSPVAPRHIFEYVTYRALIRRAVILVAYIGCPLRQRRERNRRAVLGRHIPLANAHRLGQPTPCLAFHQELSLNFQGHDSTPYRGTPAPTYVLVIYDKFFQFVKCHLTLLLPDSVSPFKFMGIFFPLSTNFQCPVLRPPMRCNLPASFNALIW